MPRKSHESAKPLPRPSRTIVREIETRSTLLYKNFSDFCNRVRGLKSIEDWNMKHLSDRIIFKKVADPFLLPKLEKIAVYSVIEVTKFLLGEGMEFILTERFCQDIVDEYFGNQRKLRRRSDNPDIRMFGYNNNTIRIQRTVSCQSGNTKGRKDKRRAWEQITDDPVLRRRKIK
eukprot:Seg2305.2 transcript_id=Seg2305.2/GoldUCD/mRNA.D3Y31 product="hypothetical protein" protein_id=Seg2305.2/GoldUCD/D3Y31